MQQRYVLQNQADGRLNGSDHIRKILRSYDDSLENDNQQTIFNNKILGNSTGKIVQKASDKLKGVYFSVILFIAVYFVYKADAIKRYVTKRRKYTA